jgi:hypothetical protein
MVCLIGGVLLLLWAWGNWVCRTAASIDMPLPAETMGQAQDPAPVSTMAIFQRLAIVVVVIVFGLPLGAYALVWLARRSRKRAELAASMMSPAESRAARGIDDEEGYSEPDDESI